MKNIISIFFLSIIFFGEIFSQKDGFIIEKINGVKYYIHSVEKGNTLYSISKKYGISIDEITKNNPDAAGGLRIGQTLKIPVNKSNPDKYEKIQSEIKGDFLIHKISEKETLYSISKKYNLKPKDLMDVNPGTLSKDIQIGQELKIPILKLQEIKPKDIQPAINDSLINHMVKKGETLLYLAEIYDVNIDSIRIINSGLKDELKENRLIRIPKIRSDFTAKTKKDSISKSAIILKNQYEIALLLPFYTDMNDSIEKNLKPYEKPSVYNESETALLFYEGVLLAMDSLKKSGVSIHAQIADTQDDSAKLSQILKKPGMENMDLIIGPFYQYLFEDAASFAKQNGIGIVCPVPQSAKVLLENEYASKVLASPLMQVEQLAEFSSKKYYEKKIILFSSNEKTDMRLSQSYMKKVEEISEQKNIFISVTDYYFADINIEKIKILLQKPDTNIIVIPSHNQVFVSDMLTKLNSISEEFHFIVLGLDKWTEFENIDVNYLHKLNVHVVSPMHIDYENQRVQQFVKKFREKYKTEPGKFGFLGFDVTCYYLSALQKYGEKFYDFLPDFKSHLLTISFDFIKTGYESGCENKHAFVLKYENYKLVKID